MIKPTIERLLKLQGVIIEQAESLPAVNFFGDKNDIIGEAEKVVLIEWIIENIEDKEILNHKRESIEKKQKAGISDMLYQRYDNQLYILDFALGEDETFYLDYFEEDE